MSNTEEKEITQTLEKLMERMPKGMTIAELNDCSKENLESLYAVGRHLYDAGEYKKAIEVFKFLVMYDHIEYKYWFSLGATARMLQENTVAISALSAASLINFNPGLGFLMVDCFLSADDTDGANSTLQTIINTSKDDPKSVVKAKELKSKLAKSHQSQS